MLRRLLIFLAMCAIVALATMPKWMPGQSVALHWTAPRRPPLQGPVQGDWFTDMSDATAWAREVEPVQRVDVGLFIYSREPEVSVAGPAQPAMVNSIRHEILFPKSRVTAFLWFVPACAVVIWGITLRRKYLRLARERRGCCPMCGYDLRASKERCPECGYQIEVMSRDNPGESARPRAEQLSG